jgi:hypothetical protein
LLQNEVAHYGSAAAETAACTKAVGLVERPAAAPSRAAATTGIAVAANALSGGEAVSIVGPHAAAVLHSSSLPADLVPGAVREGRIAGSPVAVLCEDRERFLLLFPDGCPASALEAIGDSGRPFGLARVGHEALAHMRAARRDNG